MKRTFIAMRVAISIGALTAVLWRVDAKHALDLIGDVALPWVGVALLINVLAVLLSTMLWRTLMTGPRPSLGRMFASYLEGLFYNNVGVGTIFGDASRVDSLVSNGTNAGRAVASVVGERLLSLMALLALSSVGGAFVVDDHLTLGLAVWGASVLLLAGIVAGALSGTRIAGLPIWPARVRPLVTDFLSQATSLTRSRSLLAGASGFAVAVQVCTVAATMAVIRSLGHSLSLQEAFLTVPVIALCVLLPFSIQGVGVREATYIYILSSVGVADEVALSAAVVSFSITVSISLAGAVIALLRLARSSALPTGVSLGGRGETTKRRGHATG